MLTAKRMPVVLFALTALLTASHADALDDYVKAQMEKDHIPGVCLAVISGDGRQTVRSYGFANLETQTPFSPQTAFRIASLSKQFCGYTAIKAIQAGRLNLNDPVTQFYPQQPEEWKAITIRDLLGHRSGIADVTGFQFTREYTVPQYLDLLAGTALAEKPGETYRYNNHGYSLLGLIVGEVWGSDLETAVKKHIFEAAGMTSSRYYDREELVLHRADGYAWSNGKYTNRMMLRPEVYAGSGGIIATMEDMIRYDAALRPGGGLDQKVLEQQWTPVFGGRTGYGAGWNVTYEGDAKVVVHTGETMGFTSIFKRNLETGESVIVFRNSTGGSRADWADGIAQRARELMR